MQVETLDATVINDVTDEIKTYSEQQVNEIKTHYEKEIHKLKIQAIGYQNKYLEVKEKYNVIIFRRFARSAEKIPIDDKQPLLFTP